VVCVESMGVVRGLCTDEFVEYVCILECQRCFFVWLSGDCCGKLILWVYLGCVIEEVPGRDNQVFVERVCWVHCMVCVVC